MNCKKCGSKIGDNMAFCPVCGANQNKNGNLHTPLFNGVNLADKTIANSKTAVNYKKILAIVVPVVAVVLVIIIIATVFTAKNLREKRMLEKMYGSGVSGMVDITEYILDEPIVSDCYNGFATGNNFSYIDCEKLSEDLCCSDVLDEDYLYSNMIMSYTIVSEKHNELKNGDKITVDLAFDINALNSLRNEGGKVVTGEESITKEFTVKGLKELKKVDVYDSIKTVAYYENQPYIIFNKQYKKTVDDRTLVYDNEDGGRLKLIDNQSSEENETVCSIPFDAKYIDGKVSVVVQQSESFKQYGLIIEKEKLYYDVQKAELVKSTEKLGKHNLELFEQNAKECATAYSQNSDYDIGELKLEKIYFCYTKDNDLFYYENNILYFVYSYKDRGDSKSYCSAKSEGILITKDGELITELTIENDDYGSDEPDYISDLEETLRKNWDSVSEVNLNN